VGDSPVHFHLPRLHAAPSEGFGGKPRPEHQGELMPPRKFSVAEPYEESILPASPAVDDLASHPHFEGIANVAPCRQETGGRVLVPCRVNIGGVRGNVFA